MRKRHEFRPTVEGNNLEERLVLSTVRPFALRQAPVVVRQANFTSPIAVRNVAVANHYYHRENVFVTTTKRQVDRTLSDVHNGMVRFQQTMNTATRVAARSLNRGADPVAVFNGLATQLDRQTRVLDNRLLHASGRLPYGAGFSVRPSGGPSLYEQISPTVAGTPAADLVGEMQFAIGGGDINYLADLTTGSTLRQVYSPTRQIVLNYVRDGYLAHDFGYKA